MMSRQETRMTDRIRMTLIVVAAGLVAFATNGAMAAQSGRAQAPPDPDRARLAAMTGTWDVDMTIWPRPGGAGLMTKATSTIRPLFDGLYIEEQIEGAIGGASFGTLAWTGFNPATRQYEATRISSTNPARIVEAGAYDQAAKQFELKGDYRLGADTWHQRTVIQSTSPDTMIATSYLSAGAVPEWKGVEIKYARKSK
jgi:hypothetical protein